MLCYCACKMGAFYNNTGFKSLLTRFIERLRPRKHTAQLRISDTLAGLAENLRCSAEQADPAFAGVFWKMAGHLQRISAEVAMDYQDFRALRQFANHHARRIVAIASRLAELQERNAMAAEFSDAEMLAKFNAYCDLFRRAEAACVMNDIAQMKLEMEALDIQLNRLNI